MVTETVNGYIFSLMKATVVTHRHENEHAHEIRVGVLYTQFNGGGRRDARGCFNYFHTFWRTLAKCPTSDSLEEKQQQVKVRVSVLEVVNIPALWLGRDW